MSYELDTQLSKAFERAAVPTRTVPSALFPESRRRAVTAVGARRTAVSGGVTPRHHLLTTHSLLTTYCSLFTTGGVTSRHHPRSNLHRHERLKEELGCVGHEDLRDPRLISAPSALEGAFVEVGDRDHAADVAHVDTVGVARLLSSK